MNRKDSLLLIKWEKIFTNLASNKGLTAIIWGPLQPQNKKTNNLIKILAKNLNRHFSKDIKMASKQMKRHSPSLVTRKCRLKPQLDTTSHPPGWLSFLKYQITSTGDDVEKLEPLGINGGNTKWYSCYRKVWQCLRKLNIDSPYNPANACPGIYSKYLDMFLHVCIWMFLAG